MNLIVVINTNCSKSLYEISVDQYKCDFIVASHFKVKLIDSLLHDIRANLCQLTHGIPVCHIFLTPNSLRVHAINLIRFTRAMVY